MPWFFCPMSGLVNLFLLYLFHSPGVQQVNQVAISSESISNEMEQDARLLAEVSVLLTDPVPEPFEDISDVPGTDTYDEFVDFVVPGE